MVDPTEARELWMKAEPFHAVTYFAPEVRASLDELGLVGFWMGYFAARSAPFGAVGPSVVEATFYNFHPSLVRRAIPDAWERASPAAILAARDRGLRRALVQLVGEVPERLAGAATRVALTLVPEGRPLFAAHADLDWADDPLMATWQATTRIREHRGDGHVAILTSEGVGPCESHALAVGRRVTTRELVRRARAWEDEDWALAIESLHRRGLVDPSGGLTDAGTALSAHIERRTDELSSAGAVDVDPSDLGELIDGLGLLTDALTALLPFPNPIGLPRAATDA